MNTEDLQTLLDFNMAAKERLLIAIDHPDVVHQLFNTEYSEWQQEQDYLLACGLLETVYIQMHSKVNIVLFGLYLHQ